MLHASAQLGGPLGQRIVGSHVAAMSVGVEELAFAAVGLVCKFRSLHQYQMIQYPGVDVDALLDKEKKGTLR